MRRLRNHRSGGPSGMRMDHLKGWMEEARKEGVAATKAEVVEWAVAAV